MADLYTSLVRAKQDLNGGTLPAMTPVPEKHHDVIDPDATIGLGALTEDPEKGLLCPVRGCGGWYKHLTSHLNAKHPEIGGATGVKRRLSIPHTAGLVDSATKEKMRKNQRRLRKTGALTGQPPKATEKAQAAAKKSRRKMRTTVGQRNFLNSCEAQIAQRILSVRDKIGRSPTAKEAGKVDGPGLVDAATRLYGSWNAAKAALGLKIADPRDYAGGQRRQNRESVLLAFEEYFKANGRLPSANSVQKRLRHPVVPCYSTVLKYMGVESRDGAWAVAAQKIETALIARGVMSEEDARNWNAAPRGEEVANSKLTEPQVVEIVGRIADGDEITAIAQKYGVTISNISSIANGRTWKHIKRPAKEAS